MGYFTLKDVNKNGKPILYYVEYNAAKTKQILDDIRKRYSGEEKAIMIQNSRRGSKEQSLGQYKGSLLPLIQSFEEKQNAYLERELGRPLTENEKISLRLTDEQIKAEEAALETTLEDLQLNAEIREWKITQLLIQHDISEEEFKQSLEGQTKTEISAEWKKYKNNLYQDYRREKIDAIKVTGVKHTEAQIQFNKNEKEEYQAKGN